jgi:hypothetical protein
MLNWRGLGQTTLLPGLDSMTSLFDFGISDAIIV